MRPADSGPSESGNRTHANTAINRGISEQEIWLVLACCDGNGSQVRAQVSLKRSRTLKVRLAKLGDAEFFW